MLFNKIEKIVSGGLCNGCGACVASIGNDKVNMELSSSGFYRPRVKTLLSAGEDEAFVAVCGGWHLAHQRNNGIYYDPLWGPRLRIATGHATDPEVRYRGSSGGVISAIALWLLGNGVSFIVQTTADPFDPIGNVTRPSRSREDVLEAAGSRYGPSAPLAGLERYLASGEKFAFVGKPCDVAALRRMARRDPRINAQIPYMISFFCAGIPSRLGTLEILAALGVNQEELKEFAYRGRGWPGLTRALLQDGREATLSYSDSWGQILNRHLQFRCKVCADGTGEFADIACADAWYGTDGYPDFGEREGRSLILARTLIGKDLLVSMETTGVLETTDLDVGEIIKMQPYQVYRKRTVLMRLLALRIGGRLSVRYDNFALLENALRHSLKDLIKNFIGTLRRVIWRPNL